MRIQPADPPYPEPIEQSLSRLMPPGVAPLALFRVLAKDQRLFSRFMGGGLLDRGHLSLREREICILRTCAGHGSEYEWGVHVTLFAHKAKLTAEQIEATVLGAADAPCWSAAERVLIELCDHLRLETTLPAPFWGALREHFSELALLELLMLSGFYRTVSTLTLALDLQLESWAARFPRRGGDVAASE